MGYWITSPNRAKKIHTSRGSWFERLQSTLCLQGVYVGPTLFFREILGLTNQDGHNVFLSDGGHKENFGLCELLRRRCREIIVCDASTELDPSAHSYERFATAVRIARIDLGVEIDIDLSPIELNEQRLARLPAAMGKIRYPPRYNSNTQKLHREEGRILFIKCCMTRN